MALGRGTILKLCGTPLGVSRQFPTSIKSNYEKEDMNFRRLNIFGLSLNLK